MNIKICSKTLTATALIYFASSPLPALAGACSTQENYVINDNTLYLVNLDGSAPAFVPICNLGGSKKINALAYNSDDGLLYGVRNNATDSTLVSIEPSSEGECTEREIGVVGIQSYAATIANGEYVFQSGQTLYRYGLYPFGLLGQLELSRDIEPDFFFNSTEQLFHVVIKDSNELARTPIFPWVGVAELTPYGSIPAEQSGALLSFDENMIFGFTDGTSNAFSVNIETKESEVFDNVFPEGFNQIDAASCFGFVNRPPQVAIVAPRSSVAYLPEDSISFEIAASDRDPNDSIEAVELYERSLETGAVNKIGQALFLQDAWYHYTWSGAPLGTHEIYATATDSYGEVQLSRPIQVIVDSPPTVRFEQPRDGQALEGPIEIEAFAQDSTGIKAMRFYVNGRLHGVDDVFNTVGTSGQYESVWRAPKNGQYQLTMEATDDYGFVSSTTISVTISCSSWC